MKPGIAISIFVFIAIASCTIQHPGQGGIITGASRTGIYLPQLKGKRVAVVANHTSLVDSVHLIDTLLSEGIDIRRIFTPEHGFRGQGEAGEMIESYQDVKTGLPVISLYGISKKPDLKHLKDVDVVVFDVQDVGVRFYTYISTMHYVMEACAESGTDFLVLDRPNPNGFYVDGPVLDTQYRSFVGMQPIPMVHGMTIAELGRMINDQGWLKNGIRCHFEWIPCAHYTHDSLYRVPVPPSPNLPNMQSIYLYPSIGLMEGTVINVGRGTAWPFQVFGHPKLRNTDFTYIPRSIHGASTDPKYKDRLCRGIDLRDYAHDSLLIRPRIRLQWIRFAMKNTPENDFFLPFFHYLAGTRKLMAQLRQGVPEESIRAGWQEQLDEFMKLRRQYLIYEDFTNPEK
jgi:uncharacterized protein YbbC (DUF1343 family)